MKSKFCCDASRHMYEDYYSRQTGGEIPVFSGARLQRGHGLGNVLSGVFRKVVPFIKSNVKNIGRNLLTTGVGIVSDVLEGKKFKDAAKQHVSRGLKRTVNQLDWETANPTVKRIGSKLLKTGADIADDVIRGKKFTEAARDGIKRVVHRRKRQSGGGRVRRRTQRDIFS